MGTTSEGTSFSHELQFVMNHRKGYLDHICGKSTPAAKRYVRASKRWKERHRRDAVKIKGE